MHVSDAAITSIPKWTVQTTWTELWSGALRVEVERRLGSWLSERRWFRAKSRGFCAVQELDVLTINDQPDQALWLVGLAPHDAELVTYFVPVSLVQGERLAAIEGEQVSSIVGYVQGLRQRCAVVDGVACATSAELLLDLVHAATNLDTATNVDTATNLDAAAHILGSAASGLKPVAALPAPRAAHLEQTNSSVLFGEEVLLKVYRQLSWGAHCEGEMGEFFAQHASHAPVPAVLGELRYQSSVGEQAALVLVQEYVPHQGTAWQATLDQLRVFFDARLAEPRSASVWDSAAMAGLFGWFDRLARCTAEVHLALSRGQAVPGFEPEPFSAAIQETMVNKARALVSTTFQSLSQAMQQLPSSLAGNVERLLQRRAELDEVLSRFAQLKVDCHLIRCHGDLHLGQVLCTGDEFVMIDFEGQPTEPLHERRAKNCPLRDVTSMTRSFNYAVEAVLGSGHYSDQEVAELRPWASEWDNQVSSRYLQSYLQATASEPFLPALPEQLAWLLRFYGIEKALYEIGYELNHRPAWLPIPVLGLTRLLDGVADDALPSLT